METRTNQTPPPPTTDSPPDINRRNGPIVTTDNTDQGPEEVAPTFTTTQNPLTISTTEDPLGYVHTAGEHL